MRPPIRVWVAFGLAAAATAAAVAARQDAQRPPVFRGGTTFVSVDVYPRRDGTFVDGLTKEDFQVLEDGKPQSIATFDLIRFASNPLDSERVDPSTADDGERQAADPQNRVFVVYLDVYHTTRESSRDARRPLLDFLNRNIGEHDLFTVMTPDRSPAALTFVRRTDMLESELDAHWDWGRRHEMAAGLLAETPGERRIARCALETFPTEPQMADTLMALYREDLFYTNLTGTMERLGDVREERKNLLLLSEGWRPEAAQPAAANQMNRPSGPSPIGVGRGGTLTTNPRAQDEIASGPDVDRATCRGEIVRLLEMDFTERFRDLVTQARQSNVTFYPVDLNGLDAAGLSLGAADGRSLGANQVLKTLAENTDGYAVVNDNDLSSAFRRVSNRLSAYYLLGYYSTNESRDGRFHAITVKTRQKGVDIAARRGYFAYRLAAAPASSAAPVPPLVSSAMERLGALEAGGHLFAYGAASPAELDVVADLASRDIDAGKWGMGADLTIAVADSAGASVKAAAHIAAGARSTNVVVPTAGIPAAPWHVTIRIAGDDGPPALVEVAAPSTGVLGSPVMFRAGTSGRSRLEPAAEFLFHRSERLHVEWPLAAPVDERSARVLDRHGAPLNVPVTVALSSSAPGRVTLAADVPMAALGAGDYVVEAAATTAAGVARDGVAFRVVP